MSTITQDMTADPTPDQIAGAAARTVRERIRARGLTPCADVLQRDAAPGDRRMSLIEDIMHETLAPIAEAHGLDLHDLIRPLDGTDDPAGEVRRRVLRGLTS
jgi:hypothetical protein